MAKNRVQFQAGLSLPAFLSRFGTEEQCRDAVMQWRWPSGFRCPGCGLDEVFDMDTEECWTLDGSDYGDEGSTA